MGRIGVFLVGLVGAVEVGGVWVFLYLCVVGVCLLAADADMMCVDGLL